MTESMLLVIAAMETLTLTDYADTPSTWSQDRYHFNEGARAAARLLKRHLEAVERHEAAAHAKRLARYMGVGA